jgi:DNA-binding response OmpR family regulator
VVADDDADILQLVALRLERCGCDVVRVADGEQALMWARELLPDLAVLDVTMPKLDGYEVTRELRSSKTTRAIAVILLTARVREEDVRRGLDAGADAYLEKPFSGHEFDARVRAALEPR